MTVSTSMKGLISRNSTGVSRKASGAPDENAGISIRPSRVATAPGSEFDDLRGALGLTVLHSPTAALFDIVFVHGLGGGSRKTWSKTGYVNHYWPAAWLPEDPSFSSVRIHSYGYSSNWAGDAENCLNVHHIGKAFLADLVTSPLIGPSGTSLILVGHSMGGLVIKKAYMLARQDSSLHGLADRIRAVYFVATPHRGSDSAKLLRNMLLAASVSRGYVADLMRNSGTLQSINDEFRHYSGAMELWSFYETQKLSMGILSTLIVDPESAVLGYREEKQIPMDADHRSICKFDSPRDPNYVKIRNALVSTINNILSQSRPITESAGDVSVPSLEEYLEITSNPADDLAIAQDSRMDGTCEWLRTTESYSLWKDDAPDAPPILWLTGQPGAGKSVLAGFAVDDLLDSMAFCSYYSFKHGDKEKSTLSTCLRSLAAQMASADENVHTKLVELQRSGVRIDRDNERGIWRSLFLSGIFRCEMQTHYWVIDGLDECRNAVPLIDTMLAKMDMRIPLRIFVTSRETAPLQRSFSALDTKRCHQEPLSAEETLKDIRRVVFAQTNLRVAANEDEMARLTSRIIDKARGSFLWLHLVLDELSSCYSEDDVNRILDGMPRGMEPLYTRVVEGMARMAHGKTLAAAILSWTACVVRPLAVQELQVALELDWALKIPRLADAIAALCGQLVVVDKFGKVQMIHETAREFLLGQDPQSAFFIDAVTAHARIAKTCLQYLTSDEMSPPRTGRRGSARLRRNTTNTGFGVYACQEFATHLALAGPATEDNLVLVNQFFKRNVLTWIEYCARSKNLGVLIRAAQQLKTCTMDTHLAECSPFQRDSSTIRRWSTDLRRVAAKFSDALLTSPAAIYALVIPFCPSESAVHSIATQWRTLSVVGLGHTRWDDRLACFDSRPNRITAMAYGARHFAMGMADGQVKLYHSGAYEAYRTLRHPEYARYIAFEDDLDLVGVAGVRTYSIWNYRTGHLQKSWTTKRRCAGLAFGESLLIVATEGREISYWDPDEDGADEAQPQQPVRAYQYASHKGALALRGASCTPMALSFGMADKMLAVAYSRNPVMLWDLEEQTFCGSCGLKWPDGSTSTHPVAALVLNPSPSIPFLAVAYLDGQLALLDPLRDVEVARLLANCHTLAASHDGRLLAGGASGGVIDIFEFATLQLIYKVQSSHLSVRQLVFSADGCRLADLRGTECNIWNLAALLDDSDDDGCSADTTATPTDDEPLLADKSRITAMLVMPDNGGVVCGMQNGSVYMYDVATGSQLQQLCAHKTTVQVLCWLPHTKAIASVCAANRIFSRRLEKARPTTPHTPRAGWVVAAEESVVESSLGNTHGNAVDDSIVRMVSAEERDRAIISTQQADFLWAGAEGQQQQTITYPDARGPTDTHNSRVWVQAPTVAGAAVCLRSHTASLYSWHDLSLLATVKLGVDLAGLQMKQAFLDAGRYIILDLEEPCGSSVTKGVCMVDVLPLLALHRSDVDGSPATGANVDEGPSTALPITARERSMPGNVAARLGSAIADRIRHVIGIGPHGRLVFLDAQFWVCSVGLPLQKHASMPMPMGRDIITTYTRHFFVPYDWLAGASDILCGMSQKDIVFVKNTEVAVIKGGLEFEEEVVL